MQDIARMIQGFRRFRKNYFRDDSALFDKLRKGQNPRTLIIGCCDSRVDPALLTDASPGDLFVIRNVANLVPPYCPDGRCHGVSSGIEYAVRMLEVSDIIILGHSGCGGIAALLEDRRIKDSEFIREWVEIARPALDAISGELKDKTPELKQRACEQASLLVSVDNLLGFPWVRERVDAGQLSVHGWYFDLHSGQLLAYDPEAEAFVKLG